MAAHIADLNAYLLQMETNIADFARELGCGAVERYYRRLADDRWAGRLDRGGRLAMRLPICSAAG